MNILPLNNEGITIIKKGSGGGGGGSATLSENITYSALVAKRDAGQLVAGQRYRITDYITTTATEDSQSAGNLFDLIVTALDSKTLDENARAIQSERDTDGYFANSDLNAWEVKYCLDNDTSRFNWASTGEKGATITCERQGGNEGETFTGKYNGTYEKDGTLYHRWDTSYWGMSSYILTTSEKPSPQDVVIMYLPDVEHTYNDVVVLSYIPAPQKGTGVIYRLTDEWGNSCPYDFKNIQFVRQVGSGSYAQTYWLYTFSYNYESDNSVVQSRDCYHNKFGEDCWNNVLYNRVCYNTFGHRFYKNTCENIESCFTENDVWNMTINNCTEIHIESVSGMQLESLSNYRIILDYNDTQSFIAIRLYDLHNSIGEISTALDTINGEEV